MSSLRTEKDVNSTPSYTDTAHRGARASLRTEFVTLYRAPPYLLGASRAHVVLLRQGRVGYHTPIAAARFVGQLLDALLQKALHPFVDKAAANPDCGGNSR